MDLEIIRDEIYNQLSDITNDDLNNNFTFKLLINNNKVEAIIWNRYDDIETLKKMNDYVKIFKPQEAYNNYLNLIDDKFVNEVTTEYKKLNKNLDDYIDSFK